MSKINYESLFRDLRAHDLSHWADILPSQIDSGLSTKRYGDLPRWLDALEAMPDIAPGHIELANEVKLSCEGGLSLPEATQTQLTASLQALIPWRKGPYQLYGTHIDTEWRSDWKWERISPHLAPLAGRRVLDVGCGNGYHCWRMRGMGASLVVGIDPSPRFVVQFFMIKHLIGEQPVHVLPIPMESVPENLRAFDTTFSMGVLYHRRSPMDHLKELHGSLRPGGELVLETLVIEGDEGQVLVPEGRYAQMNNVWFLPSAPTLESWLRKCGFGNVRTVDINRTSLDEQRATRWMTFHSLENFLAPNDPSKTIEGHPAPMRATLIAETQ